jgi:F-type H+-transporting ATPase subunit b
MQIIDILSQLVPNVWTAITQLCATAVLFFLMYKLAWKPVKKILDERSTYEQEKLTEAEKLIAENERLNTEAKQAILEANKTAEVILKEAREEGKLLKDELLDEGQKEAKLLLENARKDMELQHDKMMKQMHEEIVDATISAAEKVLQEKLDASNEQESIRSFIKEVIDS